MVGIQEALLEVAGLCRREADSWHRIVPALGVALLVAATAKAMHTLASTGLLLEAVLDLLLIGSLGAVLLYLGVGLPNTGIHAEYYPRIVGWVAGGVGLMIVVFGLRVLHPGVSVDFTFGTQAVLLAIGSIAGLAIGVHEAHAIENARRLEQRNADLQRTERRLDEAVSELERSNAELESTNEELEATNEELETSNDMLADSNEKLERSNEQLEQFAHVVSHDLREPLRMVTSYLQLVEERFDDLDEEGEEFLTFALDGAQRMGATIDGLLEYSRVDTSGGESEPVDLDDVVEGALADLQLRIEEADATVTREPLPTVEGDCRQLGQVFQNLLSNAIRYCGEEPPYVHVSAEHDGSEWLLRVHDEGTGIDADDVERVFDVFQRGDSADVHDGSGIGLALCDRIVENHGGEIDVSSVPGDGSTFSFTLPPAELDAVAPGPARPLESPVTAAEDGEADAPEPLPVPEERSQSR